MTDPILVTGCARSGTSLVAGVLHICGAFKGETFPGNANNPEGYFENAWIRENVTKRILTANDCDPMGVAKLPEAALQYPSFKEAVVKQLRKEGYSQGPWLYKDAKLAYMWRLWKREFPAAKWVLVVRDPMEIMSSCLRTPFMKQHSDDPAFWREWVGKTRDFMAEIRDTGALCVTPSKMLAGDFTEIRAVVAELGLEWDEKKVRAFVKPKHWNKGGKENNTIPLNTPFSVIDSNVRKAMARGLPEIGPHKPHNGEIAIVGGGPSLKRKLDKLRKLKKQGVYVLALNGTHDFLIKHRIRPNGMALMDARPGNEVFVQNPHPEVTYFIASQCPPAVFDALEDYNVVVWHHEVGANTESIVKETKPDAFIVPPLGTTVGIRSFFLALRLGFQKIHLFGLDSCVSGHHHAYKQKLNDGEQLIDFVSGGKAFKAPLWMYCQVQDFALFLDSWMGELALNIHGGGALAAYLNHRVENQHERLAS